MKRAILGCLLVTIAVEAVRTRVSPGSGRSPRIATGRRSDCSIRSPRSSGRRRRLRCPGRRRRSRRSPRFPRASGSDAAGGSAGPEPPLAWATDRIGSSGHLLRSRRMRSRRQPRPSRTPDPVPDPHGARSLPPATRQNQRRMATDKLKQYRAKRDFATTSEPAGDGAPRTRDRARLAVRRPGAPRDAAALGPAARARRRARVVGDPERDPARSLGEPAGGPHRGPSARVPRLRGRDPEGRVRRRDDEDLGPRHVRAAQVGGAQGRGHVPRRAAERALRAVPDLASGGRRRTTG